MSLKSVGSVPNPNQETEIEDLGIIESVFDFLTRDKWTVQREGDEDEVKAMATRAGKDYCVCFTWYPASELLHFGCALEFGAPLERQEDIRKLASLVSSRLYFGHLDYRPELELVVYRAAMPLIGANLVDPEIKYFLESGLNVCASYFPAFQQVLAGVPVADALGRCIQVINTQGGMQ